MSAERTTPLRFYPKGQFLPAGHRLAEQTTARTGHQPKGDRDPVVNDGAGVMPADQETQAALQFRDLVFACLDTSYDKAEADVVTPDGRDQLLVYLPVEDPLVSPNVVSAAFNYA